MVDFGGPVSTVPDASATAGHAGGHGPAHLVRHLPSLLRLRGGHDPSTARSRDTGIVALLTDAGFPDAREVDHVDHRFGRVTFVQATRP